MLNFSYQEYEPIEVGRFRQPAVMELCLPLFQTLSGVRSAERVIRLADTGMVVGRGRSDWRIRPGGVNHVSARLDHAHAPLAPFLMAETNLIVMSVASTNAPESGHEHHEAKPGSKTLHKHD